MVKIFHNKKYRACTRDRRKPGPVIERFKGYCWLNKPAVAFLLRSLFMGSQRSLKELYGTMFQIRICPNGRKEIVPTKDIRRAVDIIEPSQTEKICPHCQTDKCLDNIVGETLIFPEYFRRSVEGSHIRYFDIATCKTTGKDFAITRSIKFSPKRKTDGREICTYCRSPYVEKISNLEEIRKSFFDPSRIKNYEWVVWGESGEDGFTHAQMKSMTIDEYYIFFFDDPYRCKHCKRVFGYTPFSKRGLELFNKFEKAIQTKKRTEKEIEQSIKNHLEKLGIDSKGLTFDAKCPFCHWEFNEFDWSAWADKEPFIDLMEDFGTHIYKCECKECKKIFMTAGWVKFYDVK